MANEITEKLFQSIDTIVQKRIESLPYDQTVQGRIISTAEAKQGKYIVLYNDLQIIAYSEKTDYQIDDDVYVVVPVNDFSQKKMIIGKIQEEEDQAIKVRPFENYVPCTTNLNSKTDDEKYLLVNGLSKRVSLFSKGFSDDEYATYTGYDLLGLKVDLKAELQNLVKTVHKGTYYLQIDLFAVNLLEAKDAKRGAAKTITYYLTFDDIVSIDFYNTSGYCRQQKVFDIKNLLLKRIDIYLVQENDFVDTNNQLVTGDDGLYLYGKNINLTFGYPGVKDNFEKGQLFIYSPDGYLYNATDANIKNLYSRLIIFDGNKILNYMDRYDDTYTYKWYEYDTNQIEEIPDLGNKISYKIIENSNTPSIRVDLEKYKNVQNQRYTLSVSNGIYSCYAKDSLIFTNNVSTKNSEIVDNISGFIIDTMGDNSGVFNIYGQDNLLLNEADSLKTQRLRLSYSATASNRQLRPHDIIEWSIPKDKTMLLPAVENQYSVRKELTAADLQDDYFYLPFKIKYLYNQNATQNTIKCVLTLVEDNGMTTVLTQSKEIYFGTSGSSGSDYIFTIDLCKFDALNSKVPAISINKTNDNYTLVPHLYDYNMEDQIDHYKSQIAYTWINGENYANLYDNIEPGKKILKASIASLGLTTYIPIATKYSDSYDYIEGCKTITYDITGKKPIYYKKKYSISPVSLNIKWQLYRFTENGSKEEIKADDIGKFPILQNDTIVPPSIFQSELNNIFVECTDTDSGDLIWVQPILITQNKYPSAMWNAELNQLEIGEDKILTTMVGRIDGVSGLFFGERETKQKQLETGIFGYYNNENIFTLNTNGDIYIKELKNSLINQAQTLGPTKQELFVVGNNSTPVYFDNGIPISCTPYADAKVAGFITGPVGNADQPIYIDENGIPAVCDKDFSLRGLFGRISALESKIQALENRIAELEKK